MRIKTVVGIFLTLILGLVILFIIFASNKESYSAAPISIEEYNKNIKHLSDTLLMLKDDIARYEEEIRRIDLERATIKEELQRILRDNERTDIELATGDWDSNVRFLTDFLSKEDTLQERHCSNDNQTPACDDK